MPDEKLKAKKPKDYAKLSQKQKFNAAAKAAEADETGETFNVTMKPIVPRQRSPAR